METFEKVLLKKTPCDECRRRKRKCSYKQPCERCISLEMRCIYTVIASPKDLEYIDKLKHIEEVKILESQLSAMEKELSSFKLAQDKSSLKQKETQMDSKHHYPSSLSIKIPNPTSPVLLSDTYKQNSGSIDFINSNLEKRNQLIAKSNNSEVFLSPSECKKSGFVLSFNKGEIVINTSIKSHQDLLNTLYDILCTVEADQKISPSYTQISADVRVTTALTSLLSKSYKKQWIKSITKAMPLKRELNHLSVITTTSSSDKMVIITLQLIHAYINCLHLNQFYIHIPYFMTHFIKPDQPSRNILQSPVVMALCSTICLQTCQHVSMIIPPESSSSYARYYFEQARELISDRFDEFSLEIMITYALIAFYKFKLRENRECLNYSEIANRICSTLEPLFDVDRLESLDYIVTFYRMKRFMQYVHHTTSIYELIKRGISNRHDKRRDFPELLKESGMIPIMPSSQDSFEEKNFIQLIRLKLQLQQTLHTIIYSNPVSTTLTACVGEFSHQMEMSMRDWYRNIIPRKFQLSLPLFEDNISDFDYFMLLEKECRDEHKALKLLCLIYLYNEYLVVGKAYVPKNPQELQPTASQLLDYFRKIELNSIHNKYLPQARTSLRWEKLILRIVHFKRDQKVDELAGIESDYIERLISTVHPEEWNFHIPVARTSVIAAFHLIRLVQHLVSKEYACLLEYNWLMNAWEILLRASRFKFSLPEQGLTLERIRANILLCMNIIREHSIHEKIEGIDIALQKMEREFNDSI